MTKGIWKAAGPDSPIFKRGFSISSKKPKVELVEVTKEMSDDRILKNLLVALKKQGFKIKGEPNDNEGI